MKKDNENKNKTNELFESFLPDRTKEDPNENLKKEKKLFSIIFIVICSLLLVGNLIAMIVNFATLDIRNGLLSLFVGFINCTISIFLLGLLIVIAHNISKMTRATLFMCSKLMRDEKRLMDTEKNKSNKEDNTSNNEETTKVEDNQNSNVVAVESEVIEQTNDLSVNDIEPVDVTEDSDEEATIVNVDIITD